MTFSSRRSSHFKRILSRACRSYWPFRCCGWLAASKFKSHIDSTSGENGNKWPFDKCGQNVLSWCYKRSLIAVFDTCMVRQDTLMVRLEFWRGSTRQGWNGPPKREEKRKVEILRNSTFNVNWEKEKKNTQIYYFSYAEPKQCVTKGNNLTERRDAIKFKFFIRTEQRLAHTFRAFSLCRRAYASSIAQKK